MLDEYKNEIFHSQDPESVGRMKIGNYVTSKKKHTLNF